jgi:hypothetical protein
LRWDGIILEKYTDLKPRMFRQEEFEKMLVDSYSTVTLFARFRGLSTSQPNFTAR